jgi:hypothetical protein
MPVRLRQAAFKRKGGKHMPDMNMPNAKGKTIMDYLPMAAQKLLGQQSMCQSHRGY